jgi:radical SAM superfamily enzyme YgiQ (UPF0313 family)
VELPKRNRGDELLSPGELVRIRKRLQTLSRKDDLATVIACAFDHRTRMLPFSFTVLSMVPAGVRAIGSAMTEAGFEKTRIVLQQWNRNFRPSQMRLDGRIPDIFMVSSMHIHWARGQGLIRDACRIDPARRPLIIAGGPKIIYQPWDAFSTDPDDPWGADVAVTGEEYVLLSLLEVLLSMRGSKETLRSCFSRARDAGTLEQIPGLVYARGRRDGVAEELFDTGIQRLLGDLDELPDPVLGYRLLEPPSRKATLGGQALAAKKVHKYGSAGSLVMTFGCKFACPYCPIPAYNQRQYRVKSGERIADEMARLHTEYGMRYFFGTDDNFFNDKQRALEIVHALASKQLNGSRLGRKVRWSTEATVHDTLRMKDDLAEVHKAGVWALWLGVEDMTARLIKKGQSVDKTMEAFRLLREHGIAPMPMLMHHDDQPLYTRGSDYGLLNQAKLLRKSGAISLQVLMMSPATGSKLYEEAYNSGLAYKSVGGKQVEPHMHDANYVIASGKKKPWRKQLNILAAYLYFYNPLRFLISFVRPKSKMHFADAYMQLQGMSGLAPTVRRTLSWALRLMRGNIERTAVAPASSVPMRGVDDGAASHALPAAQRQKS